MKTHRNAERLIGYLRGQHQPVTVARVVDAGVRSSRGASDALQYGVRHSVIERIRRRANERGQYRLTGQRLPAARMAGAIPSFDALLTAWGIARILPRLPDEMPVRVVLNAGHRSARSRKSRAGARL